MLVALEQKVEGSQSFAEEYFQFMMPFTWELWGAIILMFILVTLALGFIEERLFIAPQEVRHEDGRLDLAKCAVFNLESWLYEFFLLMMAFCQAGGWWGMSNARSASGRFLTIFTEFGILIILAAYLGNITNLMLREQAAGSVLSASSFEETLAVRGSFCYRDASALGGVMRELIQDDGMLVDIGSVTGGFSAQTAHGADLLRSKDCDAIVLPQWFAENLLVMEGNRACDLRLLANSAFKTVTGGYITATPYHRHRGLFPNFSNVSFSFDSIGCMDVCFRTLRPKDGPARS